MMKKIMNILSRDKLDLNGCQVFSFKVEFGFTDAGNERNKDGFKITYLG